MISRLIDRPRGALYRAALRLNRGAERELEFMRMAQWFSPGQIREIQAERLERLLAYAHEHVPYWRGVLERTGVFVGGAVRLDRFGALPTLDKPTIRANFDAMTSDEAAALHAIRNRTGGSTGEPLVVLQGRDEVRVTGGAVTRLFYEWHGARPGDREVKLWGSTRDLYGKQRLSWEAIRQAATGITLLNAFRMTPERMELYVRLLNRLRPKVLRGYSSNLFELAQFAEERGMHVEPPGVVISSAGTLYPHLRTKMERVFGARVANHYGSREMHTMAMECPEAAGLHLSAVTHLIEVLGDDERPCPPGVEGDLVITNLLNRAMPLIRYRIGDRAVLAAGDCLCGRGLPRLARLSGRRVDCFKTRDGRRVPGEYFIHLLGVLLSDNPMTKFQVVQEDWECLVLRFTLKPGAELRAVARQEILDKTWAVMGRSCQIRFEHVEDIAPLDSGKYMYTECRLPDVAHRTASDPGPLDTSRVAG